jgi:hypothetical protein
LLVWAGLVAHWAEGPGIIGWDVFGGTLSVVGDVFGRSVLPVRSPPLSEIFGVTHSFLPFFDSEFGVAKVSRRHN